jgi:hypothetical protein
MIIRSKNKYREFQETKKKVWKNKEITTKRLAIIQFGEPRRETEVYSSTLGSVTAVSSLLFYLFQFNNRGQGSPL